MKTFPQNREKVYQDHYGCSFSFDDKDQEILDHRMENRNAISRPLVGDYVIFPTGEIERFAQPMRPFLVAFMSHLRLTMVSFARN